ncbi:DoxX family protein [Microbacterium luticocti]|uniref:DoxX family protein n=1 Tax=Microbacterium luticocti TaxID=451764 RepID=UPI00040FA3A2|nr:DoxX family protein [Microbacterium luticocti]
MLIAYFVVAGLAALAFLGAGIMKLARPKDTLQQSGMAYVEDFAGWQIKLIGLAEVLGAIGLILPMALSIAVILSPTAAICLAVIMIGAIVVHIGRKEPFIPPLILLLLSVAAAVLGFLLIGA